MLALLAGSRLALRGCNGSGRSSRLTTRRAARLQSLPLFKWRNGRNSPRLPRAQRRLVRRRFTREEVSEMTTITFKGPVQIAEEPVQAAPESEGAWLARLQRQRQIIKAYRAGLPRPPGPEPQLHFGHAGPPGWEEACSERLQRQRQIIKAYYEKRRAASEAGPLPMGEQQDIAKAA
jgi:hypothetical protein